MTNAGQMKKLDLVLVRGIVERYSSLKVLELSKILITQTDATISATSQWSKYPSSTN